MKTEQPAVTLFWFRRDLRLEDNAGLYHALKNHGHVLPLFIFDPNILKTLPKDDLRVMFIHQTLSHLKKNLVNKKSDLLVEHGDPQEVFARLFKDLKVEVVYANHDYEPDAIKRDDQIKKLCESQQIQFLTYKDQCIFEKKEILTDQQKNYTVYTPYKKKWLKALSPFYLKAYPNEKYEKNYHHVKSLQPLLPLTDLGFTQSDFTFPPLELSTKVLTEYAEKRDFPGFDHATTRLGLHLRFGTVSVRALVKKSKDLSEVWLSELIWRDFFMQVLWHFPHIVKESFKPQYEKVAWRKNRTEFKKWCAGQTGYPLVDAGMRELNSTGYMHNRVRMVTASFLTKHLFMHWSLGERYFAEKLLDYDLAANNGNWQWAAGTGCDAAPYFRIFNPTSQLERFDAKYEYVKKWVPEFGTKNYNPPMVDHTFARDRALAEFKKALKMKILMTGATGLIGKSLGQKLVELGNQVVVVSRDGASAKKGLPFPAEVIEWDLMNKPLPPESFAGIGAVIHLLGESVDGRWTEHKKTEILQSRKVSSENLLKHLPASIKTIVSASAQGIYGDRKDELLTEDSKLGEGFLADVCKAWEKPFLKLQKESLATKVVIIRIGLVLTFRGGALKKLIGLFQKNLGAALGSGKQWMSWISLRDLVEVFVQAVTNKKYEGVINAVQPNPVQNGEFTKTLAEELKAFQLTAAPAFVLKSVLGEMASLVLSSQKVDCAKLKELKFNFNDTELRTYFSQELKNFKYGERIYYDEQYIEADIEKVFKFFADAKNLEKITPPLLNFHIKKMSTDEIRKGTLIDYKLKIRGFPAQWRTLIELWNPPFQFVDMQLKGPYHKWHHTHSFRKLGTGTLMTDEVVYKLPMGYLGRLAAGSLVESDVGQIFSHRRQVIANQKF